MNKILRKKIKQLIQYPINLIGFKVISLNNKGNNESDIDSDKQFLRIFNKCQSYTMTSKARMFALYKTVKYIIDAKIPGDFVECGVWKGGSAMIIASTLKELGINNKKIYLYDTFEGASKPTESDYTIGEGEKALDLWRKNKENSDEKLFFSSLSEVKKNMFSIKYPKEKIIFVKGKVEDTIPKTLPENISLLRLDTDWYESTKHELEYLYPLLSQKGILIIDDYGCWAGAKKAVDEYFEKENISIFLSRIDSTGRLIIK